MFYCVLKTHMETMDHKKFLLTSSICQCSLIDIILVIYTFFYKQPFYKHHQAES